MATLLKIESTDILLGLREYQFSLKHKIARGNFYSSLARRRIYLLLKQKPASLSLKRIAIHSKQVSLET